MPHKKNPILSENLSGLARLLRSLRRARPRERRAVARARHLALVGRARDRARRHRASPTSWSARAAGLVDGLVVNAERMRRTSTCTGGLYFSEAVLLALVKTGLPRQEAYELVQRTRCARGRAMGHARRAARARSASCSAPTPRSPRALDRGRSTRCFDLEHHLRHAARSSTARSAPEP